MGLSDCLDYMSPGSKSTRPSRTCCTDTKTAVSSPVVVDCLCTAMSSKQLPLPVNMTRVFALPAARGSSASVFSKCNGDELWEYFPCPFCYIEVEVPCLCDHLQEEHCFDMKNAVCPICAENLGTDTVEHFRDQHSHLLKMRKPSSSKPSPSATAAADKQTYEEDSYFEEDSYCMARPAPNSSPDPLLTQFICSVTLPVDQKPGEAEEGVHVSSSPDDQR